MEKPNPDPKSDGKIRVLIVDDSSVIRTLLRRILESDPEIEVVGAAPDPFVARDRLVQLRPDVMTLDMEMPRMDGITFLQKVMEHLPVRTLVISSLTTRGSELALKALEVGAIDVMQKPVLDVNQSLEQMGKEIIARVKTVASAKLWGPRTHTSGAPRSTTTGPAASLGKTTHQILAIASSTGGTEALKILLPALPADIPGTVIVQHMPPGFTQAFATALQAICPFEVKEAAEGDRVIPGRALIAPGNYHMELDRTGAYYTIRLHQQPTLHGVRPAADFLFNTVARIAGSNAMGVVLTGMGRDGAAGLATMRKAGSFNIAQNEDSCVVFGMPKEAIKAGGIHLILPIEQIADELIRQIQKRGTPAAA